MTNKERIKILEEYISHNNGRTIYFCFMPYMLTFTLKQKLKELRNFRLLEACEDCGGVYKIYSHGGITAFMKPIWKFPKDVDIDTYNKWKIEIAKRAIELLSESE